MTRAGTDDSAQDFPGARGPRLRELLAPTRVRVPLQGGSKGEVLAELVDLVVESCGMTAEREAIHAAVLERERVLATGIGEGVAIPHAKFVGFPSLVAAAGVSREALEYGALDGRPVQLFFLILGPESAAGAQVRVLARIARLMRDERLRKRLAAAADGEDFLSMLGAAEGAG